MIRQIEETKRRLKDLFVLVFTCTIHYRSNRGDNEYDDPHFWNYDGDLDHWGTDFGGGNIDAEPALAEMSEGSCLGPSSSAA
ncbi:hypothetical protein PIB30_065429 [Stylosanthes scabra]|uniref:Uncharacterized protein n=1 Tax=Stylosanthes scabra TaxID=79078 RepID=A0ABU6RMB9_9FABA|nr:hypothetical protein [Stylosanthes scabra]